MGVSGGIAAYKSVELLRLLIKEEAKVRVIMTKNALEFVGSLTFWALSRQPVCTRLFETVDDALSLLMQRDAGKMTSRGRYPKNSINYHTVNRLYNIAMIVNGGDDE